jgi:hypothetical protein
VDDAEPLRLERCDVAALEQVRQRRHDAREPRHALRTTPARQQSDLHFREAHERTRIVGDHAVMAGKA